MAHVFISYSTKNSEYAYKLAKKLRDDGFDVWMDNAKLRASDKWWQSIVLALKNCAAFIVLMSPESKDSRWVQREVMLADKWQKPIFPVLLAGENWELFVDTHYEDVSKNGGTPPQHAGRLLSRNFIDELATHVPRATTGGADVTAPTTASPDELDATVVQQIETPPAIEETTVSIPSKKPYRIGLETVIVVALITSVCGVIGNAIGIIPALLPYFRSPTPAVVLNVTDTHTPTMTNSATTVAPTETLSLTVTPLVTSSPSAPTQVVPTTAVQPTSMIAPQGTVINIDVIRGRGLLALTINDAIDLSGLQIDFGGNERYSLGDILPASASSIAGQTWCIRQPENAASIDSCTSSNTYTTPATGNSWRNEDIIFRWQGTEIGICEARSSETAPYDCEPLLIDR